MSTLGSPISHLAGLSRSSIRESVQVLSAVAASADEARPVLTGVKLEAASDTLVGAATDSYRLAVLKAAMRDDLGQRNVAAEIELTERRATRAAVLTADEVDRRADAIDPSYQALVLVLAYGGLRFGEAVALRRGRCDLLRKRLLISESATTSEPARLGRHKDRQGADGLAAELRRRGAGGSPRIEAE